ncbi:molybdopterin-guanine dinucleotide biosynthesis protein B [Paenibacillus puldeungensis]|uniref:Molybdopterin-guanine dinucleotide biosynthesis protein B n=1 Tax=Paenibacillus puldeungensis TaxID=696536 RepID=A0ABW3RU96_9BACL
MPPVVQIVGFKNSGKTTLITRLLHLFNGMNLKVAVIKHDVHGFEVDREGTDTYLFRETGAAAAAIVSPWRTAIVEEQETPLSELIEHFAAYDLILVEGFKQAHYPKLVLLRGPEDVALLEQSNHICAIVQSELAEKRLSDEQAYFNLPCFQRNEMERIAQFITQTLL